jgi:activator of 2-hydroxyglutaryl-CoA dehydratase
VIGTGYKRYRVTFGNAQVMEISCHARGAVEMFPQTHTVLDMGGQDTKAIRVSASGEILDFCMNDKCAAGTGRFWGAAPADILHGAIVSLVDRSVQFMRRVQIEPEFTLIGGILRFETMSRVVREHLKAKVNVPQGDMVQFTTALGAAILGHQRLRKLRESLGSGQ